MTQIVHRLPKRAVVAAFIACSAIAVLGSVSSGNAATLGRADQFVKGCIL